MICLHLIYLVNPITSDTASTPPCQLLSRLKPKLTFILGLEHSRFDLIFMVTNLYVYILLGWNTWFNELVCTGLFAVGLGVFLIVLNSFISKREDDDLEYYVQRQLTRSKSGNFGINYDVSEPVGIWSKVLLKAELAVLVHLFYNCKYSNATWTRSAMGNDLSEI